MQLGSVRGVCLDLGGTVVRNPNGAATAEIATLVGVPLTDMRTYLQDGKRRRTDPALLARRIGADFGVGHLTRALAELLELRRAETAAASFYPEVRATLAELRGRGYRIAFLSNVLGAIAPEDPGDLAELADRVLLSCDIGQVKPEPGAFAAVADALEIPRHRLLHVGDSLNADVHGALTAGCGAAHLDRAAPSAGSLPAVRTTGGWWRIADLTALLDLLPGTSTRRPPRDEPSRPRRLDQGPTRGWCTTARLDPITGLVAFPDFHAGFPAHLVDTLRSGERIGLAIGDVDDLKSYVENTNDRVATSFGHLAGCAVMTKLGAVARAWFAEQPSPRGCVATFGGDEIIVALQVGAGEEFLPMMTDLRNRLREALPRTVSFAVSVIDSASLPAAAGLDEPQGLYLHVISTLDRWLFDWKARNRKLRQSLNGFVVPVRISDETQDDAGRRHRVS